MQVFGFFPMQIYRYQHYIDLNIDLNNTASLYYIMHPVRPRNQNRKHSVRPAMMLGFLMLVLLTIGIVSQVPAALGESENPLNALWNAIFDLQSKDKDLQKQIDELKAEKESLLAPEPKFVSDPYAVIEIAGSEDGRTLIHVTAGNRGPDRAAGVKLTAFYLMPLFEINSIEGDMCEVKSRGIIECTIGTLEEDQKNVITVDATARESGKANTWTVDISTTTDDIDPTNNHVTYDFETSSIKSLEIPQVEQPAEETVIEEPKAIESDQVSESVNSTAIEGEQESAGNQTSVETEAIEDSDSSSMSAEGSEDGQTSQPEERDSEESATGESAESTSQESDSESEENSGNSSEESDGVSSSQP